MKPKEKAEELVHQYDLMQIHIEGFTFDDAKECALVAVNEIIKSQPSYPMAWNLGIEINGLVDNAIFPFNYWQEVKQEIEKL